MNSNTENSDELKQTETSNQLYDQAIFQDGSIPEDTTSIDMAYGITSSSDAQISEAYSAQPIYQKGKIISCSRTVFYKPQSR